MDYEIARAFKNGDYKRASELLQNVRDFNNRHLLWFYPRNYMHNRYNIYIVTLLHLAAYHGWLDICKQLITVYKYNPHVQYSFGSLTKISTQTNLNSRLPPPPPLFYATLGGHYEVITYLINKCNCNPHQQSEEGETPLYLACLSGHYEIVTYLINKCHCDPNIGASYNPLHGVCKLYSSYTPLTTACCYGYLDIIKFLVSSSSVHVNSKDEYGFTVLHTACRCGKLDIIKFLVSLSSVDVNIQDGSGYTPLHTACRYGQLETIKCLVSLPSVDVNIQDGSGYTPLHTACRYGQLETIKFLVSLPSVDVNIQDNRGYTPLHTACHYGHLDIIKFLVSLPSVDVNIRIPSYPVLLHEACCNGTINVVKFLLSASSIDVNRKDNYGYIPLHTACRDDQLDIIKFLVSLPSVDVNIQNDSGYTPLYTACRYGHLEIIQFLLSLSSVDVNIRIPSYPVLLHEACCNGAINVVKFLVSASSIDVNSKDNGYIPLHTACRYGHVDTIKFLVSLPSIDVNIRDDGGYTPLHTACRYGQLDVIKFLVSVSSVHVNSKTCGGDTPLHIACKYCYLDIVQLLMSTEQINPICTNKDGDTPLHIACNSSNGDMVKYLLSTGHIDPMATNKNGDTPLHIACSYSNVDIVKQLLSTGHIDPMSTNKSGDTPLHIACRYYNVDIVKYLLSTGHIDVNIKNNDGYIPLLTACHHGQLESTKLLVSSSLVDVNIKNNDGDTPLHIACQYGELQIVQLLMSTAQINPMSTNAKHDTALHKACSYSNVDIVKYLLSTGRIDPMAMNRYQETPVQLAGNNYGILKLFDPFKQCRVDFPVESYSKVFLCGNTTNGKSSLANALEKRVKGVSRLEWLNPFKQQKKVEPLTAGIVPHHLQSIEIGNIVLYDFAGHPEYYSSHEAVLENLMLRSPAVFIILIKLTDKLEDIDKQLYYWTGFLENVGCRMSKKSQVIVVGSHADKRGAENGINLIKSVDIQRIIEHHEYKGFVAVDCRNKDGVGFDEFVMCLSESTKSVVNTSDSISFYCHVLYAFLKTKLDQVAITLDNLLQLIQDENEPSLPSNESVLLEFLTILSDKGLIVFIRSINSWVIINKSSLLKEINGTLFAPSHFKEYRSTLASNTGIVPVFVLSDVFPQYDPDMLVGFLKSLEFCHEIDENTLKIVTTNLSSSSEKLLYFPALVSVEPSSEVTITDGLGWCLWCPNPYQFFSTRFLQVLLLRIAYLFSLQINDVGIIHMSPVQTLDRSCHVWKNGISWTRDGVKTVVQVSEQNRSVILLVQPLDEGLELEVLQVSSSVIQKILQIKEEFCHSCDTRECLISPHHLNIALQYNLKDLSVFKVEDIARVLILKKMFVTSNMTESLNISSLLGQLEPYHSLPLSVIHQLFDDSKVSNCIPEHVFREIQERCRPIMDIYPVTRESSTYQSVRDHLNRFSMFAGRNPFVSE